MRGRKAREVQDMKSEAVHVPAATNKTIIIFCFFYTWNRVQIHARSADAAGKITSNFSS